MNKKFIPALSILLVGAMLLSSCGNVQKPQEQADRVDDMKWWQETIAYEIYIRSFKDSDGDGVGDINGITSELDHLEDLGVGAIWLTPCYDSPQADNGYDVADYYKIDPTYGTMEDMDNLIKEADKRNIRIVMDLVFNHTSDQNEWFQESKSGKDNEKSDWYIWRDPAEDGGPPTNWRSIFGGSAWEYDETRGQYYLHTFLKEQPDLNWENPEVRKALIDVANFWVDKGVGGFRLDAITYNYIDDAASGGCLRLLTGNSYWVYKNCGNGTRVHIYGDLWDKGPIEKDAIDYVIPREQIWDPSDPSSAEATAALQQAAKAEADVAAQVAAGQKQLTEEEQQLADQLAASSQ